MDAIDLKQSPAPGTRLVRHQGDVLRIELVLDRPVAGRGVVRTNIGRGDITRREIIEKVTRHRPLLGKDWFDIPMQQVDDRCFRVSLPLLETGHFEAKTYFLPAGRERPQWPRGDNLSVNISAADACCANVIYNAFVRQFGAAKSDPISLSQQVRRVIDRLDADGYTVIPPSGTFRDLIACLDFIIGSLGCRYIQLLPVHPTPTTYARMGRFGSPYAALSFKAVDPALAAFDPAATPMEQFFELVDAIHDRRGKVLLDIAINHTGWAARMHESHPEWLKRDASGRIEVPGAWGVTWADLTRLDYAHQDLWTFMAEVFLLWCRRGVDGFRCDAGYMIPHEAWEYIIAEVRSQFPATIFLLEGLGGKISVTRGLLNTAGFDWAYSELFQNYDRGAIELYLPLSDDIAGSDGGMIHFAETHDNNRLAARSARWARMRTALCALCADHGGFGFANGVEWLAEEKIDVHGAAPLNWGHQPNLVDWIRRLNALLHHHPVMTDAPGCRKEMIQSGEGNVVVLLRRHLESGRLLVVAANLDDHAPATARWQALPRAGEEWIDLLTASPVRVERQDDVESIALEPAQVVCLSRDPGDLERLDQSLAHPFAGPPSVLQQRARWKAMAVIAWLSDDLPVDGIDVNRAARDLTDDPEAFCSSRNRHSEEPRVIAWRFPADLRREVMIPPGFGVLVMADADFRVRLSTGRRTLAVEDAMPGAGGHFALILPPTPPPSGKVSIHIWLHGATGRRRHEATAVFLPPPSPSPPRYRFDRDDILTTPLLFLDTNGRGGMLRAHGAWGALESRYDALLAANLDPEVPDDRWIMLTRCRAWIVYQDYSQPLSDKTLVTFSVNAERRGIWEFDVPTGQGQHVRLRIDARMIPQQNAVRIGVTRLPDEQRSDRLPDPLPVRLILRPDLESRNHHHVTKAYTGPEHQWPSAIRPLRSGFRFSPEGHPQLAVEMAGGEFVLEPEWQYMVHRRQDAQRGMDPDSDLFSPGYFAVALKGGDGATLQADISPRGEGRDRSPEPADRNEPVAPVSADLKDALWQAMAQYIVRRNHGSTVIAGYPWFLDWGRDTLIALRGMIAHGRCRLARSILEQFALFESGGTLPNMIRGADAGNRDTSDAPLWFFTVCKELMAAEKDDDLLEMPCGRRPLGQILVDMADAHVRGTESGVVMDHASGLLYSPAHFTWMDTNHPAGSPRQGYPIEIQALWHNALAWLAEVVPGTAAEHWRQLADQVRQSIRRYFYLPEQGYCADCLHAGPGVPAADSVADDHLRPNQLFAITLGAIDDRRVGRQMLGACAELIVPGAIRSLADRPVQHPLDIRRGDRTLNDPHHPYQGTYGGDEDTQRKPAYHNGTAWTWVFPSFCEAWAVVYGPGAVSTAMSWLSSGIDLLCRGCVGHMPEILDGDAPHTPRGCDAQAWGISEWLRVWHRLASTDPGPGSG